MSELKQNQQAEGGNHCVWIASDGWSTGCGHDCHLSQYDHMNGWKYCPYCRQELDLQAGAIGIKETS